MSKTRWLGAGPREPRAFGCGLNKGRTECARGRRERVCSRCVSLEELFPHKDETPTHFRTKEKAKNDRGELSNLFSACEERLKNIFPKITLRGSFYSQKGRGSTRGEPIVLEPDRSKEGRSDR